MTNTLTLHRHRTRDGEALTLLGPDYRVTIEVTVRGLDLDAGTLERLLHAPLTELARDASGREMI